MAKVEVVVVRETGKRVNTFKKRFLYSCIFVDLIYHIWSFLVVLNDLIIIAVKWDELCL